MKFTRQQYLDLMTFQDASRPMFCELFGPLVGLEDEWRAQGAAPEELSLVAFDWDYVPVIGCGGQTGTFGGPEPVVLEDTPVHRIERDRLGRTVKVLKQTATIPLPLDFPVRDMDDWFRLKPLFQFHEGRIDARAVAAARAAQAGGALVRAGIPGGFDMARELMGEELACLAYYDQPELMHDILATLSDTAFSVLERVSREVTIDQLTVHEDLAGRSGPLVGPEQVRTWIAPYYRRIWELLHQRGTRLFDMDSDGNISPILDALLESGLNSTHPLEPAAGMDMVQVRQQYGQRLALKGGINKFVLVKDKAAIRRELEYKMQPLMRQGGTVFGLDHRIPNGTPLEHYRYYVDLGREILGLPARNGASRGWERMAF